MDILFLSEANFYGKIGRDHPNMRTDLAWQCALQSDHVPIHDIHNNNTEGIDSAHRQGLIKTGMYDYAIVIVPKKNPHFATHNLEKIRAKAKKVAIMQEGPNWYYQDYSIEMQIEYLTLLTSVDLILCHNQADKQYFRGIVKDQVDVKVMPTLMITDGLSFDIKTGDDRFGAMIGGNFVSWYGGIDSMVVASELDTDLFAPSMGRKQDQEESLDISYYPYMNWKEWMQTLNNHQYGVHMMRTHAAGSFSLNCAYLGIPCIGYTRLDTQQKCHPELSVDDGNLIKACKLAKRLSKDKLFYDEMSKMAKHRYNENFSESNFIDQLTTALS